MNRSGRSLPAGPAITPQASSGGSALAWAMIAARSAPGMVSTHASLLGTAPARESGQRPHQGFLEERQPVVHVDIGRARIVRPDVLRPVVEVVGDLEAYAQSQPDVVQGPQPGLRLRPGQPDPAAARGQ